MTCKSWIISLILLGIVGVSSKFIPANDSLIGYSGRVKRLEDGSVEFDWSGITISTVFTGTSISMSLLSGQFPESNNVEFDRGIIKSGTPNNGYNIFLDNEPGYTVLNTTSGQNTYQLASGLDDGPHYLYITKRTEALFGIETFQGFEIDDDAMLLSPAVKENARQMKLEIIGDSITCGFGDEGVYPCDFTPYTENNYLSYGPKVARMMNLEYHLEAWSGKGLVRNYGDPNVTSKVPFPKYYPYTLANNFTELWNSSSWVPDAVMINLGTNDFSTQPNPPQNIFEPAYKEFIAYIANQYISNPDLYFFLVCGPMIGDPCCQYVENVVNDLYSNGANVHFVNLQNTLSYPKDEGCDGHPNLIGHGIMANITSMTISKVTGWPILY